jgi:hypothetical protein
MNVIKSSWVVSGVCAELKTSVSGTSSVSIIRTSLLLFCSVSVVNPFVFQNTKRRATHVCIERMYVQITILPILCGNET